MEKLQKNITEQILSIIAENELSKQEITSIFEEVIKVFDQCAIIPERRRLSRTERESLA